MDLGKLLRKRVREILWPFLREHGFTEFSDLAAWRKGLRWIDCVQVMTLGATEFGEPRLLGRRGPDDVLANAATFSLDLGCYYTDVHLLPWTGPAPDRPRCPRGQGPRYATCHRIRSLARSYEFGNVQGTLFPSADDGSDLDIVLGDALEALRARGLAWLETTHDIDLFLARADGEPAEYRETQGGVLKLSDEEEAELAHWKAEHGIGEDESFTIYGAFDLPAFIVRRMEAVEFRDHTAMDSLPPYGNLYYGLLVGSGRAEQAIEALGRDSDPADAERRYSEMLSLGIPKRQASALRRRENSYLQAQREHLAMLRPNVVQSSCEANDSTA